MEDIGRIRLGVEQLFSDRSISSNRELKNLLSEDSEGYISVRALLLNTHLIKITQSVSNVKVACEQSTLLEVAYDPLRVRRKDWKTGITNVDEGIERVVRMENIKQESFSSETITRMLSKYGKINFVKTILCNGVRAAEIEFNDTEGVLELLYCYRHGVCVSGLEDVYICTLFEYIEFKKMRRMFDKETPLVCFHMKT